MGRRAALFASMPVLAACGTSAAAPAPAGGPAAGPAVQPAHCGPAGAPTLAASAAARVYEAGGFVYGCSAGGHRQYRLGARKACLVAPRLGPVVVAGDVAAYAVTNCGIDTAYSTVTVRELTHGKTQVSADAISHVPGPESFQQVKSIVASQAGIVAWISLVSSPLVHRAVTEVHRADVRGAVLLDSGPRIVPGSLRLHGWTLTWRDAGKTRSATVPPFNATG